MDRVLSGSEIPEHELICIRTVLSDLLPIAPKKKRKKNKVTLDKVVLELRRRFSTYYSQVNFIGLRGTVSRWLRAGALKDFILSNSKGIQRVKSGASSFVETSGKMRGQNLQLTESAEMREATAWSRQILRRAA